MILSLEKPRHLCVALFIAALVNVSVMMMRSVDADVWLYQIRIDCFAQQFWQGDLYPRWCMSANAGLGSSVFLFYFPLPFYIAALFYPLTYLGITSDQLFTLLCLLATFLTALTSYRWLRDMVTPGVAFLASSLMLFVPYRLEMMYFRGAYAEIWVMALLPLIFMYTRRMVRAEGNNILPLALVSGLSLLTHVPSTISAFMFSGLYLLMMTGKNWKPKLQYGMAVLWGVLIAAFYLVPGMYYKQFLAPVKLVNGFYGWANGFFSFAYLSMPGLERPVVAVILTVLWFAAITPPALAKRQQIADNFVRRETIVWCALFGLTLFMLVPMSLPVYMLMGQFREIVFPWRMQVIFILAIGFMLAIRMQWMFSPGRRQTWKLDYALVIIFLWAVGHIMVASYGLTAQLLNQKIRTAQIVFSEEYRTRWTDEENWKYPYLLKHYENREATPNAQLASGKGNVEVKRWGWDGIELKVDIRKDATIRLNQSHFPVWSAMMDGDRTLEIRPEEKTGRMLLDVPAGEHVIVVTYSILRGPNYILLSQWTSVLGLISMLFLARPKFRKGM